MSLSLEMKRRHYVSKMGDLFAIPQKSEPESGVADRFAKELSGTKLKNNSVRGLESLAWSTDSIVDILDYIRIRAGRDRGRHEWANNGVGVRLADFLKGLDTHAEEFYKTDQPETGDDVRQLHLELCREFIKHLTALYEFHKSGVTVHG